MPDPQAILEVLLGSTSSATSVRDASKGASSEDRLRGIIFILRATPSAAGPLATGDQLAGRAATQFIEEEDLVSKIDN